MMTLRVSIDTREEERLDRSTRDPCPYAGAKHIRTNGFGHMRATTDAIKSRQQDMRVVHAPQSKHAPRRRCAKAAGVRWIDRLRLLLALEDTTSRRAAGGSASKAAWLSLGG